MAIISLFALPLILIVLIRLNSSINTPRWTMFFLALSNLLFTFILERFYGHYVPTLNIGDSVFLFEVNKEIFNALILIDGVIVIYSLICYLTRPTIAIEYLLFALVGFRMVMTGSDFYALILGLSFFGLYEILEFMKYRLRGREIPFLYLAFISLLFVYTLSYHYEIFGDLSLAPSNLKKLIFEEKTLGMLALLFSVSFFYRYISGFISKDCSFVHSIRAGINDFIIFPFIIFKVHSILDPLLTWDNQIKTIVISVLTVSIILTSLRIYADKDYKRAFFIMCRSFMATYMILFIMSHAHFGQVFFIIAPLIYVFILAGNFASIRYFSKKWLGIMLAILVGITIILSSSQTSMALAELGGINQWLLVGFFFALMLNLSLTQKRMAVH